MSIRNRAQIPHSLVALAAVALLGIGPAVLHPNPRVQLLSCAASIGSTVAFLLVLTVKVWNAITELRAESARNRAELEIYRSTRLDDEWRVINKEE